MLQNETIQHELGSCKSKLQRNKKELSHLPSGKLLIQKRGSSITYTHGYNDGAKYIRVGITKRPEQIQKLIRKAIISEENKLLEKNIAALSKLNQSYIADTSVAAESAFSNKYHYVPRHLIQRPVLSPELNADYREQFATLLEWNSADYIAHKGHKLQISTTDLLFLAEREEGMDLLRSKEFQVAWERSDYPRSEYRVQDLKYPTSHGFVRSKSEQLTVKILDEYGICFHYEEIIDWAGVKRTPDFIALSKSGKLYFIEYWGMVNDENYLRTRNKKLSEYHWAGINPWDNLIELFDCKDGSFDEERVKATLLCMLLR